MSYAKFAATTGTNAEPAKIRFWYTTDELFNSVSLRSTYRANMVRNKEGEAQLDDVAISQDEKDIMIEFLKEAIYDVSAELFKITEGIAVSTFANISMTINSVATICSGFEIKDNVAFNANLLPNLDQKIENTIRYSILREWYASVGMETDVQINAVMAQKNMSKVKNLTFQLRKPLMS